MSTEIVLAVHSIFNEVQRNSAAVKGCDRKLQGLLEQYSQHQDDIILTVFNCYDRVLLCAKKEPAAERILKFFSHFFSHSNDEIFRSGMEYLLWRSQAPDKTARFRSLQTISTIMASMSDDAEIAQDLWDSMALVLLPRLKDKAPNVRLWAVRAMKRIQNPGDEKDQVIKEFVRLMSTDSSKDIRY